MKVDFDQAFAQLKSLFDPHLARLAITGDNPGIYAAMCRKPSPFPQHKGEPMWVGEVREGKAYVSFHFMPLYMNPKMKSAVTPGLKKRMQGKTCFNFKAAPEPEILDDLRRLVESGIKEWIRLRYL